MIIATKSGLLVAAELIKEEAGYWLLQPRDQKTPVRVNKQDDNKRAFTHMGDALRWAGDPELAKQFDAEGKNMQIRDYMTKLFEAFGDVEEVTEMLLEQAGSFIRSAISVRAQACFWIVRFVSTSSFKRLRLTTM